MSRRRVRLSLTSSLCLLVHPSPALSFPSLPHSPLPHSREALPLFSSSRETRSDSYPSILSRPYQPTRTPRPFRLQPRSPPPPSPKHPSLRPPLRRPPRRRRPSRRRRRRSRDLACLRSAYYPTPSYRALRVFPLLSLPPVVPVFFLSGCDAPPFIVAIAGRARLERRGWKHGTSVGARASVERPGGRGNGRRRDREAVFWDGIAVSCLVDLLAFTESDVRLTPFVSSHLPTLSLPTAPPRAQAQGSLRRPQGQGAQGEEGRHARARR